ncbi:MULTISPECIES: HD domain-containing protein [unclassified Butyrivibrio]|uniref:HD domain-containing protein n=1 Tax=unclassified Butyrivibrio TaxID=2639466 RepID=UPI0005D231C8|nr:MULTISPECIES: HD domain-containing protein [unclassified Butyrivibrio]
MTRQEKFERHKKIRELLHKHGKEILSSRSFILSHGFIQHGDMSVYEHSINVADRALRINRFLHVKCKERELVRGALLHDYFLYDWHKDGKDKGNVHPKLHGFFHPGTALKNASRDFVLTPREKDIIKKHMWPLTIVPPLCREAWVVTLADKYCSTMETLGLHKAKIKVKYIDIPEQD